MRHACKSLSPKTPVDDAEQPFSSPKSAIAIGY